MKSVASETEHETETEENFPLMLRKRARTIVEQVFPGTIPDFRLIEWVVAEIVIPDESGIVEDETEEEIANLVASRAFAKEAYGDDSPAATMAAYEAMYETGEEERWRVLHEKLDKKGKK